MMMPTTMSCCPGGKVAMSAAVLTRTWPDSTLWVSSGMPLFRTCFARLTFLSETSKFLATSAIEFNRPFGPFFLGLPFFNVAALPAAISFCPVAGKDSDIIHIG